MRNPLQRHYGQGHLHFITFSCYRRKALLGTVRARDRFVKILDEVRCRHRFRLIGYVVMPEHVHLLMSEAPEKNPSKVLQVLKQKVARVLLKKRRPATDGQLPLPFGRSAAEERHFWQRRFYDFNVWSERKLREKLEYMHANPVQRKLVGHPKDWPWSSWANYAGKEGARIRIDSVGGENEARSLPRTIKTRTLKPEGCGTLPAFPALPSRLTREEHTGRATEGRASKFWGGAVGTQGERARMFPNREGNLLLR